MTKSLTSLLTIFGLLVLTAGCDRPVCENTNPIFEQFSPDEKEYKNELVKQLSNFNKSEVSYWMDSYQENNGTQSILVKVQGDGLCAKILFVIDDSDKGIEEILKNKGKGYHGAELENVRFDVKKEGESYEFMFKGISGIVD